MIQRPDRDGPGDRLTGEAGDVEELRRLADKGNSTAADQLIKLATKRGDMAELQRLADGGNAIASDQPIELREEGRRLLVGPSSRRSGGASVNV